MALYYCTDCGSTFDEPKVIREKHGFDRPPYEYLNVCPECGSSDIDLSADCKVCGETKAVSKMFFINGAYYCSDCFDQIPDPRIKPSDYGMND